MKHEPHRRIPGAALFLASAVSGGAAAGELASLAYLPEDSLGAIVYRVDDLGTVFDEVVTFVSHLDSGGDREATLAPLRRWEEKVGVDLHRDLLARIGTEIAIAASLDSLDPLLGGGASGATSSQNEMAVLEGLVFVFGIREREPFEEALRRVLASANLMLTVDEDGWRTVRAMSDGRFPAVHYRYHGGFAIAGFGRAAPVAALRRNDGKKSLAKASDFLAVSSQVRPSPDRVLYVNLPRIRELLERSGFVQAGLAKETRFRHLYETFVRQPDWDRGAIWCAYRVDGGTVRQNFIPVEGVLSELLGTPLTSMWLGITPALGMMSSVLESAVEEASTSTVTGSQKRTMADLRTVAVAVESYAIDNNGYPGPTDGYVGARWLVPFVEPAYVRELPQQDSWGNALLFWSDGQSYVILSTGRDGVRDWEHGDETSGTIASPDDDIVFRNGLFHRYPGDTD